MTASTSPIFTNVPQMSWTGNLISGTNTYDGTSGATLLMTAGANGSYLRSIFCEAAGSNVVTVVRVFVNNGSSVGSAGNNALIYQQTLPATTAIATAATTHIEIPLNITLKASYSVYVVMATSVSAGWQFTALSGDY